jgi:hypothetical protein
VRAHAEREHGVSKLLNNAVIWALVRLEGTRGGVVIAVTRRLTGYEMLTSLKGLY